MTEVKIDQMKAVPDGRYVCAKMAFAFENGKFWIEPPTARAQLL